MMLLCSTAGEECMGGIPSQGKRLLDAAVARSDCAVCGHNILDL